MEVHYGKVKKPIVFDVGGVIIAMATIVFVEIAEIVLRAFYWVHFSLDHLQIITYCHIIQHFCTRFIQTGYWRRG